MTRHDPLARLAQYKQMDLKEEEILGSDLHRHWYYIAKGRALRQFLRGIHVRQILDVGAGSGVFSRQLIESGICDSAVCVDPNYREDRTELHDGSLIHFTRQAPHQDQQLVLMMDVIEHIDDDLSFVRSYADKMPSGGYLLATVPAFQFLWSGHDIYLEHKRRYTLDSIETLLSAAGLTPVRSRYFFASLFPAVAAIRLLRHIPLLQQTMKPASDLRSYPDFINRPLILIHNLERSTFFRINRLFGLSVFSLFRKD